MTVPFSDASVPAVDEQFNTLISRDFSASVDCLLLRVMHRRRPLFTLRSNGPPIRVGDYVLATFPHGYAPYKRLALRTLLKRYRVAHERNMLSRTTNVNYTRAIDFVLFTNIVCILDTTALCAHDQMMKTPRSASRTPHLYRRLGTIIKERRHQLGLTQKHLSNQLGISRASLANVETGRQRVLVHQLYHFAEKLDVNVTTLLPDTDESEELGNLDDLFFSENLSLEQRRQIARLLREDDELQSVSGGDHDRVDRNSKADTPPS